MQRYEITVDGRFSSRWRGVFDPFEVAREDGGTTVLAGFVADDAVLFGLLRRFEQHGLTLISLRRLGYDTSDPA